VAVEAGAAALPVVASRVDGIAEAVKDGENGILLDHTEHQKFADTIIELLRDESRCLEFGKKAKCFVRENYSWTSISRKYLAQFKELASVERKLKGR